MTAIARKSRADRSPRAARYISIIVAVAAFLFVASGSASASPEYSAPDSTPGSPVVLDHISFFHNLGNVKYLPVYEGSLQTSVTMSADRTRIWGASAKFKNYVGTVSNWWVDIRFYSGGTEYLDRLQSKEKLGSSDSRGGVVYAPRNSIPARPGQVCSTLWRRSGTQPVRVAADCVTIPPSR